MPIVDLYKKEKPGKQKGDQNTSNLFCFSGRNGGQFLISKYCFIRELEAAVKDGWKKVGERYISNDLLFWVQILQEKEDDVEYLRKNLLKSFARLKLF